MRVVIDSSVVIAAIHRLPQAEAVLQFILSRTDIEWVVSTEVRAEYQAVLKLTKFAMPKGILYRWLELLDYFTLLVPVLPEYQIYQKNQLKNWIYWECALSAQADFLIMPDHDFQQARKLLNTKIISTSLFKRLVCDVLA